MASHALLEPAEEDALHSARLLGVEDKLYKRLSKRLLAPTAPVSHPPRAPPTPPPDADAIDEAALARSLQLQKQSQQLQEWREDALLDFAGYESNLVRVQFLFRSNELERERYAAEKERIMETASGVKEGNARLHVQLEEAREMLAVRKGYDALAEEITRDAALKPRAEQESAIAVLEGEIAELEREREDYERTWGERREQFGRIVEEGEGLLRLIRDEKEEAELREGSVMEGVEGEGGETPRGASRGSTPKIGEETQAINKVHQSLKASDAGGISSTPATSRAPSPAPSADVPAKAAEEDITMDAAPEALKEGEEEDKPTAVAQDGMDTS